MKKNHPEIICWRITSKCNRNCPFCFRPDCRDLATKEVYKIIDNLARHGIRGIGITGGEPLLRRDIVKILKYIWEKNIKICLATNTDSYSKYQRFINKYITTIGIPIEGSTKEIHESLRGANNFRNVINAVDKIYEKGKIQMYFSTVITKDNIEDLANIENLLAKYRDRIVYWKIYDIINYPDRSFQSMKNHGILKTRIKKAIDNLGKKLGKNKILYLSPDDRSEASLIINPDGEVIVPINKKTKTKDFVLGNLLKDKADKVFDNWSNVIDYNKYICHKCALSCMKKKTLIIYNSVHHGNTEKVAKVMAEVLGAKLLKPHEVDVDSLAGYDLIGFGSGIYFYKHHKSLFDLVDKLPNLKNKKAFVFSTSGIRQGSLFGSFNKPLKKKLLEKSFDVIGEFFCPGWDTIGPLKFIGGINRGRPSKKDLKKAEDFAKSLLTR